MSEHDDNLTPDSFDAPLSRGPGQSPDEAIIGPAFTLLDAGLLGAPPSRDEGRFNPFAPDTRLERVPEAEPLRMPSEETRRRNSDGYRMLDQEYPYPSGGGAANVVYLTVQEVDGSPSITAATIKVRNGCLTDEGSGIARLNSIGTEAEAVLTVESLVFVGASGLLKEDFPTLRYVSGLGRLHIGVGSITVDGKAGQATVFNELGVDQDFRVEGDTVANLLVVDASLDGVGVGTDFPGARLHVLTSLTDAGARIVQFNPAFTLSTSGGYTIAALAIGNAPMTGNGINVSSGVTNSSPERAIWIEWRKSSGTGTSATSWILDLYGGFNSSGGTITDLRGINLTLWKTSGTTTTGYWLYLTGGGGSGTFTTGYAIYFNPQGMTATTQYSIVTELGTAIFNDSGGNYDFRIEGDTDANLLFLDASVDFLGVGTGTPAVKLDINGGLATRATSPATITADQNDYAIGAATFFRLATDAQRTITGMTGGVDGKWLVLRNTGAFNLVLANQSGASSAANRIITGTAEDLVVAPDETAVLIYDATTQRWQVMA